MQDIRKKINFLRNELHNHNHRYYVEDNPILTDLEFDLMLKELEELEAENPQNILGRVQGGRNVAI